MTFVVCFSLHVKFRTIYHPCFDYDTNFAKILFNDDSLSSNFGSKMVEPSIISNARFTYVHDYHKFLPLQAVDTHHIVAQRSVVKPIVIYLFVILLVAYVAFLHFEQGKPVTTVLWCLLFGLLLVKLFIWRPIVKESVIIMPAFGVQLETHYGRYSTYPNIYKKIH
ncbi:uncharacterized protein LOC111883880 [Lactuca sativa]|uniref:Uncharacterized protein n=1 Tax=Lactuca sativa TaxID=4236 RepID=A0A9R1V0N2_LACSA|nr:uncharacterized protein LOC111883880 [Lactuca sativa]KAJ0197068.1 hypothetical protein LSAT_V11C700359080 [Lactuca sativa]